MKIRYAVAAAGIVSALVAGPVLSQADNTNSRWSPSPFDTWMDRDYSFPNSDHDAYEQAVRRREAIERHERLSGVPIDPGYAVVVPDETVVVSPDESYGVSPDPSRVGPSTSSTNPTGNELQGENGGGK